MGIKKTWAQAYIAQRKTINFNKNTYNAGTQNWKIRQDAHGRMYFANNEGVLVFDGASWQLFPLPNRTIVRSLEFGADGRLYVGGQDEIGYLAPGKNGTLAFTSIKNLIPAADQAFSDVWDIVNYKGDIFFRTNQKIFRLSKGKITVYRSASWLFMGLYNNQLLAQDEQKGLLSFANGRWQTLIARASLPTGFLVTCITPFNNAFGLLTTGKSGVYLLAGKNLIKFNLRGFGVDNEQYFSAAAPLGDGTYLISSNLNGVYLVDGSGAVIENIAKKEGLQNVFVRSMYADAASNVWLGLDNGIDFIAYNNAVKHVSPAVFRDGGGYAMAFFHNSLYFALSNGIYQVPVTDMGDLSYVKNNFTTLADGQAWNIAAVDGHLLAGREDGLYEVQNGKISPIYRGTGFWIYQPLTGKTGEALIAAGNYNGVRLFEDKGVSLLDKGAIAHYAESSRFLEVDANNIIWTSHPYRGIYRIDPRTQSVKNYNSQQGLPSNLNNFVFKIQKKVVIATEKGIYEYDAPTDSFKPSVALSKVFGKRSIRYLKEDAAGNIWFVENKNLGVIDYSAQPVIINFPELNNRILSGFENVYPINPENVFVGSENGFYHINYAKYRRNIKSLKVYIRSVRSASGRDSLFFGGYTGFFASKNNKVDSALELGYQYNSLHFEYTSPVFADQSNVEYSYQLDGFDAEWSEWSKRADKDYTNLPAGNYTFKVKARSHRNNQSAVTQYVFTIQPPWYQTIWAYAGYVLAIAGLLYVLYQQQEHRHNQKKKKELRLQQQKNEEEQQQLAYQHQLELERSEKELANLKNEKLQAEVEFKTSELASSALNLVQNMEFLTKIKEELQRLQKTGKEAVEVAEIKKIQRMLTEEDKLNQQWEQFYIHFDKVHAGFLSLMKERYPAINQQELKLCAYLIMNLSSKEIAQLMAISVRGVEISRYRLRKKLQLPTETNLFEFLFNIQQELMK